MMKTKTLLAVLMVAGSVLAQAPIPLTINSQVPTAPEITPYQASRTVYRVSFLDGTNPVTLISTNANKVGIEMLFGTYVKLTWRPA